MELSKVSKAIAGALVTMLVAYLARHGVTLDPVLGDTVNTLIAELIAAAVGYVAVWLAPKNK